MPEEIQEEELLGWVNENENALQPPQQVNENIQLGFFQVQDSWPQRDSFGPYPEMLSKKSFYQILSLDSHPSNLYLWTHLLLKISLGPMHLLVIVYGESKQEHS
jgi:hypothetical protein